MDNSHRVVRFTFGAPQDRPAVERDLGLALFCAEGLYGPARLRLEAAHAVADDGGTCVIASWGPAAEAAVRLFAAFPAARVGEDGFTVEHVDTALLALGVAPRRSEP